MDDMTEVDSTGCPDSVAACGARGSACSLLSPRPRLVRSFPDEGSI